MRLRTLLLIVFILLLAGFVVLNLGEFTRPSVLNLGLSTIEVPLGLVMLLLLIVLAVGFLANALYTQSKNMLENRTHTRELTAQRDLADKAEASRFTELRSFLESQAQEERQREAVMDTVLEARFQAQEKVLLARMEQMDNAMAAYMGELEDRLERKSLQSSPQFPELLDPKASGPRF